MVEIMIKILKWFIIVSSHNFNKIHAKIVKQYVYAEFVGFQSVKMAQKKLLLLFI
jgi:hypothetical protein